MFKTDEIDIKHYWFMILRQKKIILAAVCAGVLLATIMNLVTPPVYEATTRVEVNKEPTHSALTGDALAEGGEWRSDNVALFTTAELITARSLMREVVISLRAQGILKPGEGRAVVIGRVGEWVSTAGGAKSASATEGNVAEGSVDREIDWLLSILTVKPIKETRLVSIQVEHRDPRVAREIADTVARKFVDYQRRLRSETDNERTLYLRQQADDLGAEIDSLEKQLYGSRQAGLTVLEGKQKGLMETTAGLSDTYAKTKVAREEAGDRLARVQKLLADSTFDVGRIPIQSETLEGLQHDLQQRQAELARSQEIFKDKHPKLIVLQSEIDAIHQSIRDELSKSVASLQEDYNALVSRERTLRSNIGQTDAQVRDVNDRLGQHATLENDLKSKRDLHTLLVAKVHEAEIGGQVQQPLVKVVEPATVGQDPIRPRRGLNLMLGLAVGLVSGLGIALLLEYLRQCIRTPKDVVEQLHLPVLGMIPRRA
ncbi:MAG TPA: GumC family protein [Candidatus Eisenbacteria bacterium]|nr:GumC family protein [Candidatus Eisenbacteria bacterium]